MPINPWPKHGLNIRAARLVHAAFVLHYSELRSVTPTPTYQTVSVKYMFRKIPENGTPFSARKEVWSAPLSRLNPFFDPLW